MSSEFVVPEGQQWIIYRSGRFDRLVGSGPLKLRAKDETVEQRIDTRNTPRDFEMDQLFWRSTQFSCILRVQYRLDLLHTAGGDRQRLAALVQFSDVDRYQQAKSILREILRHRLGQAGSSAHSTHFPMVPGSEECRQLLLAVRNELTQEVLDIGIIVDPQKHITVEWLDAPPEILSGFDPSQGGAVENRGPEESAKDANPPKVTVPDYYLSADDLKVLKSVPPAVQPRLGAG